MNIFNSSRVSSVSIFDSNLSSHGMWCYHTGIYHKKQYLKVQQHKFANQSYEKVLIQLRSHLRGAPYDNILDDIVTDLCPPINGMSKRYGKLYKSQYICQKRLN